MEKRNIFFITGAIVFIIALVIAFLSYNNEKNFLEDTFSKDKVSDVGGVEETSSDGEISYGGEETSSQGGGGGGGGSSGGDSGSGEITYPNLYCEIVQIPYSLVDSNETINCVQELEGICVRKIVNCSVEVRNLDYDVGGIFETELRVIEEGKNTEEDAIDIQYTNVTLQPRMSTRIYHYLEIIDYSEEKLASKELSCFYRLIGAPEKESCYELE
jgi:hypothetical protein